MMKKVYAKIVSALVLTLMFLSPATDTDAQTYCTPPYYYSQCFYNYMYIAGFSTSGGTTNISNLNSGCGNLSTSYTYYSTMTHTTSPGSTINFTLVSNPNYYMEMKIFVDWNADGDFTDAGETVHSGFWNYSQSKNGSFTVPSGTTPGVKRMRIRARYGWCYYYTLTACSSEYYGEAEDYNINVCNPISITSNPASKTLCVNASGTFTVLPANATGYQWQVDAGSGFTNINNNANYNGATTNTLTVTPTSTTLNNNKYRVNVTGCGTATSSYATLTVWDSTKIATQSISGDYCEGVNTNLMISTIGADPNSLQWQVDRGTGFVNVPNGGPYMGYNNDTLTIAPLADSMNGFVFRCITTSSCNMDTTDNINIAVDLTPAFITDPQDVYIKNNEDATFTVTSKGKANYRWEVKSPKGSNFVGINDGANYEGALTQTLKVKSASIAQAGYEFRCLLTGAGNCNSVHDTSEVAKLYFTNTLGVAALENNSKVSVFPNPAKASDNVLIKTANGVLTDHLLVTVIDKLGKVVAEHTVSVANNTASLNISKLIPGNYMISIKTDNNDLLETVKFVKE